MRLRLREIPLALDDTESDLPDKISNILQLPVEDICDWKIVRQGIDARRKPNVLRIFSVDFSVPNPAQVLAANSKLVSLSEAVEPVAELLVQLASRPKVLVVGMGPAGLFAASQLAEAGAQVVLIERGRPVAERVKDVQRFWLERELDCESNIQFGEGGAGTFSDGKLTCRLNDPLMRHVLETLVQHGAPEEILWRAKPHVGSDRLRAVLVNFRKHLLSMGVEIRFSTKLTGLQHKLGRICAAELDNSEELPIEHIVLALGHSARDTYQLLSDTGVALEPKAFAIGLRVEHPLELINRIQYGMESHPQLPAAEYSLAWNDKQSGRGTYSFCMCPGGTVVNAASEKGGLVVNGMSDFRRDAGMSNSALVVSARPEDFPGQDPLAGARFQRHWEQQAFIAGGGDWSAPAQPLLEFMGERGGRLNSSCRPHVAHADLSSCLPGFVVDGLRQALPHFNRRMKGFVSESATLIGVESRTSAPLRILRSADFESISHAGLYPAGEGAGYAGGIMSAAVDGIKVAKRILQKHSV